MPQLLQQIVFTPGDERYVQDFDCGDEPWCIEVADWIKGGPGGVLDDMREYGTEVWLYLTQEDGIIGYGSLGYMEWAYPNRSSDRQTINLIPNLAVQRRFHGQPPGDPDYRYSVQILDHLRFEAIKHTERAPALGLFVHPENTRAIRFYTRRGFINWSNKYRNRQSGVVYQGMLLKLP